MGYTRSKGGKGRGKGRPGSPESATNWREEKKNQRRGIAPAAAEKTNSVAVSEVENRIVNSNLCLPWLPTNLSSESRKSIDSMLAESTCIASTAWVPMVDLSDTKPAPAGSLFGGSKILVKSGSELPVCLNCKASLSFVCQIERESLLHPFQGKGLVQVFACAICTPNKSIKSNRAACWASVINPQDPVELRDLENPAKPKRVVKWLPRKDFMHPFQAQDTLGRSLSSSEWAALGEAQIRGDKIGGFAPWLDSATSDLERHRLKCKVCDAPSRLLVTIDSFDNASAFEWGCDGCLMVFECPSHPEQVTAFIMST